MLGDIDVKLRSFLGWVIGSSYEEKIRPAGNEFLERHAIDRDAVIEISDKILDVSGEYGAPAYLTEVFKAGTATAIKALLIPIEGAEELEIIEAPAQFQDRQL